MVGRRGRICASLSCREFEPNGQDALHSDGGSFHSVLIGDIRHGRLCKICGATDLEIADGGARRPESAALNGETPMVPFWLPLAVTFFVILAFAIPGFIIILLMS